MNRKSRIALQLTMGIVCAFHLFTGLGVNVSPAFVDAAARMYGADPQGWSPEFLHILKPLGAFMMALGAAAAVTAMNPDRYRAIVYIFAGLFAVRALHRIIFSQEITEAFGIPSGRNMGNMAFFFGLAAVLVVLDQLAHRGRRSERGATA
jgi:hypothetical protein